CEVGSHHVHVVGEVLPRTGYTRNLRLAAEFAFGSDFAGHARHLGGECIQLVDHRVDRVLQLQNFAFYVHGDLARQVTASDCRRYFGNVANLSRKVARHGINGVGKVFPCASYAGDVCLTTQATLAADFTSHTGDFRSKRTQLLHHGVESFLQLEDLSTHVDCNLLGEVAGRNRRSHLRNVADLASQVAGHEVHVVSEVLPGSGHTRNLRLAP